MIRSNNNPQQILTSNQTHKKTERKLLKESLSKRLYSQVIKKILSHYYIGSLRLFKAYLSSSNNQVSLINMII